MNTVREDRPTLVQNSSQKIVFFICFLAHLFSRRSFEYWGLEGYHTMLVHVSLLPFSTCRIFSQVSKINHQSGIEMDSRSLQEEA